jgi:hypothetical protein
MVIAYPPFLLSGSWSIGRGRIAAIGLGIKMRSAATPAIQGRTQSK